MKTNNFNDLTIDGRIKDAIKELNYETMTDIQVEALPLVLAGQDIIAQAPTGTGKTCCYSIPAVNMIDISDNDVQVLILCPTRELAIQVTNEVKKIASLIKEIKVITVYGGQDIEIQMRSLRKKPQIMVGTPGRIMDHMRRGTIDINKIKMLVLDEADEMLDMGFKEDLDVILKDITPDRQTLLFSATLPDAIKKISKEYQKNALFVKTTCKETDLPNISQYYVEIDEKNKIDLLSRMIDTYNFKQALVFCRTKKKVDELSIALTSRKYAVECLHGDLRQAGREKVMEMFRSGMIRVLIATDVAARGIDIDGIDAVFNYDIPDDVEYYIHRIGRTARAGRDGSAYTFVTRRELSRIKEFIQKTKTEIIKVAPPTYREAEAKKVGFIINNLINMRTFDDFNIYQEYINNAIKQDETIDATLLAAAFLRQMVVSDERFADAGLDIALSSNKDKNEADYQRIFINLGRKDGITIPQLIDIIRAHKTVEKEQIKRIDIASVFSFFEVPIKKAESIINELKDTIYNGRIIDLEIANKKSSSRKRDSSKSSRRDSDSRSNERKPRNKEVQETSTNQDFIVTLPKKKEYHKSSETGYEEKLENKRQFLNRVSKRHESSSPSRRHSEVEHGKRNTKRDEYSSRKEKAGSSKNNSYTSKALKVSRRRNERVKSK